MVWKLTPISF